MRQIFQNKINKNQTTINLDKDNFKKLLIIIIYFLKQKK